MVKLPAGRNSDWLSRPDWPTIAGSDLEGRLMAKSAVIAGMSVWLPPDVLDNEDLRRRMDTSPEWIVQRTGIRRRHVVSPGMGTGELAVRAGELVLKNMDDPRVDAVVVATASPDRLCPAVAPEVAWRLGCGTVAAFDVGAGCSGFLYGLADCAGLIAGGLADRVLFIAADAFTTFVNPADRAIAPIFGDGAAALVLRGGTRDDPGALGPFCLGSDGEHADLVSIAAGGSRQRSAGLGHQDRKTEDWYVRMAGRAVFHHAVRRMAEAAQTAADRAAWRLADVDCFAFHQANLRIVEQVAARLGIPSERIAVNIDQVGNTVAASVPLALAHAMSQGRLRPGHRVLLAAFGAGFTWGATTLVWPQLRCAEAP
jgi:3-oxoacyl-[acyl-carrier-protein] synthase-3